MRILRIVLDNIPPSVNHAYKTTFRNSGLYMNDRAKVYKKYVGYLAVDAVKKQNWKKIESGHFFEMRIMFEFKNNHFSDPNNLLKILIDSFEGIVFENDKWLLPQVISAEVTGKDMTVVEFLDNKDIEGDVKKLKRKEV